MKKIVFLVCFIALGCSFAYAGPYVVGVNQINDLLFKIEKGTGDEPPTRLATTDEGPWRNLEEYGISITPNEEYFHPPYLDNDYDYAGFVAIDFADKGYKQKEGTVISLVQPSLYAWDYSVIPDELKNPWENDWTSTEQVGSLEDYFDRTDISYLELIDFSGNDFHSIEIDGGPYGELSLTTLNLSNNPNLSSLTVENCEQLELLDIRGTALSATDIEAIKESVWDASPDAVILADELNAIDVVTAPVPAVYIQGNTVYIKGKASGEIVTVYDLFGRILITSADSIIDLTSFGSGVYLVKVNNQVAKVLNK